MKHDPNRFLNWHYILRVFRFQPARRRKMLAAAWRAILHDSLCRLAGHRESRSRLIVGGRFCRRCHWHWPPGEKKP